MARSIILNKPDGDVYKEAELEATLAKVYGKDTFLAQVDEQNETLILSAVED